MDRFSQLVGTLLAAFIATNAVAGPFPPAPDTPRRGAPLIAEHRHRPGEILVKFRPGVAADQARRIAHEYGAAAVERLPQPRRTPGSALERWRRLSLPPGLALKPVLDRLARHPNVEWVEPNYRVAAEIVPDDPGFPEQWGLANVGQLGGLPGADVGAVAAWDLQTGSPAVIVAVPDSGVDTAHPDLAANLWVNPGELPDNNLDDDGNGYIDDYHGYDFVDRDGTPQDPSGHGTGVAGVSWRARIMALRFLGADGAGDTTDAIEAIVYALDHGAQILNASWGAYTYSQALDDALHTAAQAGMLVVAAAGNDNSDNDATPHYPSGYEAPNVIAVAATDRFDARANFSNYGATSVDLGAPGREIYSTFPNAGYAFFSGTSLAAPHVAGAAALLLAHDPALDANGLKALLLDRSAQTAALFPSTASGGRLDVFAALNCDPTQMTLGLRAPSQNFAVLADEPTVIRGQVTKCGHAETDFDLTVSFDNGDPDLPLFDDGGHGDGAAGDGIYANYWTPQQLGPLTLTVTANHPSLEPISVTRNGEVRPRVRYRRENTPYQWIDASVGVAYSLGDDGSVNIPIGFDFEFYGLNHNTVTIHANGFLAFGSALPAPSNTNLPDPAAPNNLIAPLWDDLNPGAGGVVYSLLEGSAPNRRLTVAWVDVPHAGSVGTASFAVTLYEGTQDIVFQYQDVDFGDVRYDHGASATVGIEDPQGLDALPYSVNQGRLQNATAQRFYVEPAAPEITYQATLDTAALRSTSGELIMSVVDGDGINNNHFSILRFATDGDVIVNPAFTGDASGSLIPGPAHLGDGRFVNEISQLVVYGSQTRFTLKASVNGTYKPFPDSYAFYLLDSSGIPYPTDDPLGTDALIAVEIDDSQPVPQVFYSDYATATVETVGAPVADPGGPYAGYVGIPVDFDGSGSYDPESGSLSYAWDFGDGTSGTGISPGHVYSAAGIYTVTLVVHDGSLRSSPASTTVAITDNQPPVANAGPDQTVAEFDPVTLDGMGSGDPDGAIAGYAWTQTAGPAVTLNGANTATPNFTAPAVAADSLLAFSLTVTDDDGDSAIDAVNVTVIDNQAPVANAGADQSVNESTQVTLDGAGSGDPDGAIAGYAWTQTAGPAVTLNGANTATPNFTAPAVAADSLLSFVLTVTDDDGDSAADATNVTVRNVNLSPIADAGSDQSAESGSLVSLDGSGSTDPDGGIVGYAWVQTAGPAVTLNGADTVTPSFTVPSVASDTALIFQLTVTDNDGAAASDSVTVTALKPPVPPVADAGPDQTASVGETVFLDGTDSSDQDGTVVGYGWSQLAGPNVTLTAPDTSTPSFTAPTVTANTTLTFELRVTDDSGRTATDTVDVTVSAPDADSAPSVVTRVTAVAGEGDVAIAWDKVSGATRYNLYWSTSAGVSKSTGNLAADVSSPHLHADLTDGVSYHYVVTAANDVGESAESVEIKVTPGERSWGMPAAVSTTAETDVATDGRGAVMAVWSESDGAVKRIWAKRHTLEDGWTLPTPITTSNTESAYNPRIAMNVHGDAVAVWTQYDGARYNLWASRYSAANDAWSAPELVEHHNGTVYDEGSVESASPRVGINASGLAAVVWLQEEPRFWTGSNEGTVADIVFAGVYLPGSGWLPRRMIDDTDVGYSKNPRVAINDNGAVWFTWDRNTCDAPGLFCIGIDRIVANRFEGGTWGTVQRIADSADDVNFEDAHLAMDGAGNALIVWERRAPGSRSTSHEVWMSRYDRATTTWSPPSQVGPLKKNGAAFSPQVAMNIGGDSVMVWQDSDGAVAKYAVANAGFEAPIVVSGSQSSIVHPQVAVDNRGNAMVVWKQSGATAYTLGAARYLTGNGWQGPDSGIADTVTTDAAPPPVIAADSYGNAAIIWQQSGNSAIWMNRFAVYAGMPGTADSTPPITTAILQKKKVKGKTVFDITLNANEPATTYFRITGDATVVSGGSASTDWQQYNGLFRVELGSSGLALLSYFSVDAAGNQETGKDESLQ